MYDGLESLELHDNVFFNSSGSLSFRRSVGAVWSSGAEVIAGSHNWIQQGATDIPTQLLATVQGLNPGFPFPYPMPEPLKLPPRGRIEAYGSALAKPRVGSIEIGAFECE